MKIEQIDANQIRCTLTREDLARRNMRISELAYGTEKARTLFHDMMHEAAIRFNFDVGDLPIMVEAVPMNAECLVLVITRIENPEELDTRFSNFTPSLDISADAEDFPAEAEDMEEDFFSVFSRIRETSFGADAPSNVARISERFGTGTVMPDQGATDSCLFSFASLHEITAVAKPLRSLYDGVNSLYNDTSSGRYLLLLEPEEAHPDHLRKVSARLSEYGRDEQRLFTGAAARQSYLDEHCTVILKDRAIQTLSMM